MLKIAAVTVAILLASLLAYASTKPDTFQVQRTLRINAPAEKIAPLLNDFHRWGAWSPYEKLDPAMQRSFSGSPSGVGAVYAWEGNSKAGAGRMEILETSPSRTRIQLDFQKPFECHNVAEFTLEENGGATNVTWAMHGPNPYLTKVMSTFFDMDKMVGKDFEAGLANLKAIVEG
jgi:hypothetical protein